eukprot:scaffold13442_cov96-Skeletonema_dohrnii-CCMP3373.AAC.4
MTRLKALEGQSLPTTLIESIVHAAQSLKSTFVQNDAWALLTRAGPTHNHNKIRGGAARGGSGLVATAEVMV